MYINEVVINVEIIAPIFFLEKPPSNNSVTVLKNIIINKFINIKSFPKIYNLIKYINADILTTNVANVYTPNFPAIATIVNINISINKTINLSLFNPLMIPVTSPSLFFILTNKSSPFLYLSFLRTDDEYVFFKVTVSCVNWPFFTLAVIT